MADRIFEAFEPDTPPPVKAEGNGITPRKRGPNKAKAAAPAAEKAPRKKRGPNKRTTVTATATPGLKLDMATAFAVASLVKDDDMPLFTRIATGLLQVPKSARIRIAAALGKLFQ